MNIPIIHDFNKEIRSKGELTEGVGFFSVSYNPDDGRRSSASVAYIHPILRGEEKRPNLTILTNAWVSRVNVEGDTVTGVDVTLQSGVKHTLRAKKETILCAGAIDTPRLMLLSGLGPREQLSSLGIPVIKDLPGVGENLLDHPETIIIWELNRPVPPNQTTMDSDAGIFLRREAPNAAGSDGRAADIMMHCYQIPFCLNTARLGYETPVDAFCMTPNIPRPRSRGRLYLTSADPSVKPALDFRYFTDPEGYDAATIVAGLKARAGLPSRLRSRIGLSVRWRRDLRSRLMRSCQSTVAVWLTRSTTLLVPPRWEISLAIPWLLSTTSSKSVA